MKFLEYVYIRYNSNFQGKEKNEIKVMKNMISEFVVSVLFKGSNISDKEYIIRLNIVLVKYYFLFKNLLLFF